MHVHRFIDIAGKGVKLKHTKKHNYNMLAFYTYKCTMYCKYTQNNYIAFFLLLHVLTFIVFLMINVPVQSYVLTSYFNMSSTIYSYLFVFIISYEFQWLKCTVALAIVSRWTSCIKLHKTSLVPKIMICNCN